MTASPCGRSKVRGLRDHSATQILERCFASPGRCAESQGSTVTALVGQLIDKEQLGLTAYDSPRSRSVQ